MQQHRDDNNAIRMYRAVLEARISGLLKQAGSTQTVEDIKTVVFNSNHVGFRPYLDRMLELLGSSASAIDMDSVLPVIQDAWNYFPHLSLDGQCPMEVFANLNAGDLTISQPPDMDEFEIDGDKIDDAVLALLLLGLHDQVRVWKSHDWTALDHLFQKGYITDPASKAKSVMLTDIGMVEAERLFRNLFSR